MPIPTHCDGRTCPLADSLPDMVVCYDAEGRRSYVNRAYCEIAGIAPGEALGRGDDEFAPAALAGEPATRLAESVRQVVATGLPAQCQVLWQDDAGRLRSYELRATPAFDANGDLSGVLAIVRDISERRRAEDLKRRHRKEFQILVEDSPDIVIRYDRNCLRIYANPAYVAQAGKPLQDLLGRRPTDRSDACSVRYYEQRLRQVVETGLGCELELAWPGGDGQIITSLIRLTPELDADGSVAGVIAVGRDISALKESQRRLERAESLAQVGHWEWDFQRQEPIVSAQVCRIFGRGPDWRPHLEEVLSAIVDEDRERLMQKMREAYMYGVTEVSCGYRIVRRSGETAHLHSIIQVEYGAQPGHPLRLVGTTQDVTKLKTYEYHVHDLTYIDTLTGLPNRTLFIDRARQALAEAPRREKKMVGIMLLDLDRFKKVNDGCGHDTGDGVLREVGTRLRQMVRSYDTVARLSGDEFAILLPNVRETANLERICHKIFDGFAAPFRQQEKEIFVTPSIGIAVFPQDTDEIGTLLQYADTALGHAKESGRSCHRFYTAEITAKAHERLLMEGALRQALKRPDLELHYQPQIDLATGRVTGAEALMRWSHPELGAIPPSRFIPVAEATGLIAPMGEWALATAFRQAVRWNAGREDALRVAVNLSSKQFRMGDLAERIFAIARETACRPAWIELEITESILLDEDEEVRSTLQKLAAAGFSIAIDDFGTGYSALGYLHRFPIHTLKIDRSFINGMLANRSSAELVKAIISMAHALRLKIVAEGIEYRAEESFLQAHGTHLGQGYLYGKPMPAERFDDLLNALGFVL